MYNQIFKRLTLHSSEKNKRFFFKKCQYYSMKWNVKMYKMSYDLFVEAWRKPKMSFFGLNFKQCMRVKKNTNKNRPLWLQFSVKRRTREFSFDEKKNIIVLKLYVLCWLLLLVLKKKKNTCQVFSKWNAHCTYLLRFEVQKVKLLNSLFNKLCIYVPILYLTYTYIIFLLWRILFSI